MSVEDFAERAESGRTINLADYGAERFAGPAPPVRWLVEDNIPLGVAALLASQGGVGKSYTTLALGLRVALPPAGNLDFNRPILGGRVVAHGSAVILTSEDDASEVHRRLAVLDPHERRQDYPGRLRVVPLPDAGGPLPLFTRSREGGAQTTPEWDMLCEQLRGVPDIKLVVFDPLSTFAQVDLDADNTAVAFITGKLMSLATELGATVLACHHMRKQQGAPKTLADARERIRGASNLVDGVRCVYALWLPDDETGEGICAAMRIPYTPGRVVKGGIVKTNRKGGQEDTTYIRTDDGLLLDRTSDLAVARRPLHEVQRDDLIAAIAAAAEAGHPFTLTGEPGLDEKQRHRLPASLRDNMGKEKLRKLGNTLLEEGVIVRCQAQGSGTTPRWLDVPTGPFARGVGTFALGAAVAVAA